MIELHGGEIEWAISERFGIPIEDIVSFASTVSPIIPETIGTLKRRFKQLYLYPPREPRALKRIIADYEGLKNLDSIILGSGSTELIHLFAQVLCKGEALIPVPTYSEYETAVIKYGKPVFVPARNDFNLDIRGIKKTLSRFTRAVILCNPCNPTGRLYNKDELLELAETAKERDIVLFVDEAYLCFTPASKRYSMIPYIDTYPLFVIKSLSKLFGVPSFRVGWGIGSRTVVESLSQFKIPNTMGNMDIWAAERLLRDIPYQERVTELIAQQRQELFQQLSNVQSLRVFPTDTNFFLVRITDEDINSSELFESLARKGLVIRDCASMRGLSQRFFRVTIRTSTDNAKLIESLREVFEDGISAVASMKEQKAGLK